MSDETITDEYLDRLQAICDAATEGPWRECRADDGGCICGMVYSLPTDTHVMTAEGEHNEEKRVPVEVQKRNATFTAESRTALPLLIAEVRRLRGEVEAANDFQLIATNALVEAGRAAGLASSHIEGCGEVPLSLKLSVSSLLRNAVQVADILPK